MTLRRTGGMLVVSLAILTAGTAHAQTPQAAPRGTAPAVAAAPPAASAQAAPAPSAAAVPAAAPAAGGPPPAAEPGTAPAAEAGPPSSTGPTPEQGNYNIRLKSLERNVNELKEQVFRTKARLSQLKETVLGGVIGASRGLIRFRNDMGGSFRLVKVVCALDGVQIFSKADESGRLSEMKEFDIYNGAIQPGSHTVSVQLVYMGHGYGVFSYLKGYRFNVRSSNTFVAGEGRATGVTVVGYEKGGVATNMEDKPAVEFRVNLMAPEGSGTTASK